MELFVGVVSFGASTLNELRKNKEVLVTCIVPIKTNESKHFLTFSFQENVMYHAIATVQVKRGHCLSYKGTSSAEIPEIPDRVWQSGCFRFMCT